MAFPKVMEVTATRSKIGDRWVIGGFMTGSGEGEYPELRDKLGDRLGIWPDMRISGMEAAPVEAALTHGGLGYSLISESFEEYSTDPESGKMYASERRRLFALS